MSVTEAIRGFAIAALSLSVVRGQDEWCSTYSYSRPQICALEGSTATLRCNCRHLSSFAVEKTFWFTNPQGDDPVDVRALPQYAGRVQYECDTHSCTLTIRDLRESDSNVYNFKCMASQSGVSYRSVRLSVTGLKIKSGCSRYSCAYYRLQCQTSCDLTPRPSYIWYKDGKETSETSSSYSDWFDKTDSLSCAVEGHSDFPSPPVCVYGNSCKRVNYSERSICAFKGSSVDISATYTINYVMPSKFWFIVGHPARWEYSSSPRGLSLDSDDADRFQVLEPETGRSTLRISNLGESDSAEYRFGYEMLSSEWRDNFRGTTLTVKDADLQVQVIRTSFGPTLVCHSSCILSGRSSFAWYKNQEEIQGETSPSYRGFLDKEDRYSCVYQQYRSPAVYAPNVSAVLRNDQGISLKDTRVSVTCSIDANPTHTRHTWYKNKQMLPVAELELVFTSIQSSDSGEYHCTAENSLGKTASNYVFINVTYGPQASNLSVTPSGEIVEGRAVTLTCSSDANPAAVYTWYRDNRTLLRGPGSLYRFSSISSEDRGLYCCKSENRYGQLNSTSLFLDVQYGPKVPAVSASPSAEMVEGSSVNLTCQTDANPAAGYTWYKEDEASVITTEQIFTITDVTAEHVGVYYCEVHNTIGRTNATLRLTIANGAWKSTATGTITTLLLVFILFAVFLWVRQNESFTQRCKRSERPEVGVKMSPVCEQRLAAAQTPPAELQDDLQYGNICFSRNQTDPVYSNVGHVGPQRETEEEEVTYSTVRFDRLGGDTGTTPQRDEDSSALYSTVNKHTA